MKNYMLISAMFFWINSLSATTFSVYEANYPDVKDNNVNIDDATLVIHPRGNFVELNLYMTVSYDFNSWFFKNYNELEFQWAFSLPEHAVMHDFWIWFGDSIMSCEVLDKWTAELLFSDVSSPVRNPGLMTQSAANYSGQVDYNLRLFPLIRNEKKRFMIQYLLPARPTMEAIRVWLPTTQLVSGKTPAIDRLKIIYKYDQNATEPDIIGTTVLEKSFSPEFSAWLISIPLEYDQFVELVLPSPIHDKYYFSTYERNGEYFYHLAVYPPEVPAQRTPRNMLILIDFNRFNSANLDGEFLLSYLKECIQAALTENDSLNCFVAYDEVIQGSDRWVDCSEASVDRLFSEVMRRSFPSYSYFIPLIEKGSAFINRQSDPSEVLIFTNTDEFWFNPADESQKTDIEEFAVAVLNRFTPGTKIHIVDLDNKSRMLYNYQSKFYEPQMASFYGKMTYTTGGNLFYLYFNTIKTILGAMFYENVSHFESVEVQLRLQEGYAHSKHLLGLYEGYYPLHFPVMQVGKFDGRLPLKITVLGKIRMTQVTDQFTIQESDVIPGNYQIMTSWYGDHIRSLLRYSYHALTVNDIIELSIDQQILTPYTGFLIFYPDSQHGYCQDCIDETEPTPIESAEHAVADSTADLMAYPNPFNDRVNIAYRLPDGTGAKETNVTIFNLLGQKVRSLDIRDSKGILQWNAENIDGVPVTSGVYLVAMRTRHTVKTMKLLLMR